jgi:hypothetical protein
MPRSVVPTNIATRSCLKPRILGSQAPGQSHLYATLLKGHVIFLVIQPCSEVHGCGSMGLITSRGNVITSLPPCHQSSKPREPL